MMEGRSDQRMDGWMDGWVKHQRDLQSNLLFLRCRVVDCRVRISRSCAMKLLVGSRGVLWNGTLDKALAPKLVGSGSEKR